MVAMQPRRLRCARSLRGEEVCGAHYSPSGDVKCVWPWADVVVVRPKYAFDMFSVAAAAVQLLLAMDVSMELALTDGTLDAVVDILTGFKSGSCAHVELRSAGIAVVEVLLPRAGSQAGIERYARWVSGFVEATGDIMACRTLLTLLRLHPQLVSTPVSLAATIVRHCARSLDVWTLQTAVQALCVASWRGPPRSEGTGTEAGGPEAAPLCPALHDSGALVRVQLALGETACACTRKHIVSSLLAAAFGTVRAVSFMSGEDATDGSHLTATLTSRDLARTQSLLALFGRLGVGLSLISWLPGIVLTGSPKVLEALALLHGLTTVPKEGETLVQAMCQAPGCVGLLVRSGQRASSDRAVCLHAALLIQCVRLPEGMQELVKEDVLVHLSGLLGREMHPAAQCLAVTLISTVVQALGDRGVDVCIRCGLVFSLAAAVGRFLKDGCSGSLSFQQLYAACSVLMVVVVKDRSLGPRLWHVDNFARALETLSVRGLCKLKFGASMHVVAEFLLPFVVPHYARPSGKGWGECGALHLAELLPQWAPPVGEDSGVMRCHLCRVLVELTPANLCRRSHDGLRLVGLPCCGVPVHWRCLVLLCSPVGDRPGAPCAVCGEGVIEAIVRSLPEHPGDGEGEGEGEVEGEGEGEVEGEGEGHAHSHGRGRGGGGTATPFRT